MNARSSRGKVIVLMCGWVYDEARGVMAYGVYARVSGLVWRSCVCVCLAMHRYKFLFSMGRVFIRVFNDIGVINV